MNKKQGEVIRGIRIDESTYGFNMLEIYIDVDEVHNEVLEDVLSVHDVLDVPEEVITPNAQIEGDLDDSRSDVLSTCSETKSCVSKL